MQYVDTLVNRHNPTDLRLLRKSINKKNGEEVKSGKGVKHVKFQDFENEGDEENQVFKGKIDPDDSKANLVVNSGNQENAYG